MRLAVNTGEAIVDLDARPETGETMVVGDVVNTASRLQSAAPVERRARRRGDVRRDARAIAYAAAARCIAKGKAAPIEVWLALSAAAAAGERTLSRRRSSAGSASSICSAGSGTRCATSAGRIS